MILQAAFARSADFSTLEHINGLTVSEIERRARRIVDKRSDELWRVRSTDGFLGADQTLRGVLAEDWHTVVTQLRLTHQLLAHHLIAVLRNTELERARLGRGPAATISLVYDTSDMNADCALRCDKPVHLLVSKQLYAGRQFSLFARSVKTELEARVLDDLGDDDDDEAVDDESANVDDMMAWNAEYTIENVALKLRVLIGGTVARDGTARGVPSYIERFGFYEGGDDNAYRVPPLVLIAVLSGRVHAGLVDEVQRRHAATLRGFQERIDSLRSEGARFQNDVGAQQWVAGEVRKLERERDVAQAEHDERMKAMSVT
jgi:hypothetical protein